MQQSRTMVRKQIPAWGYEELQSVGSASVWLQCHTISNFIPLFVLVTFPFRSFSIGLSGLWEWHLKFWGSTFGNFHPWVSLSHWEGHWESHCSLYMNLRICSGSKQYLSLSFKKSHPPFKTAFILAILQHRAPIMQHHLKQSEQKSAYLSPGLVLEAN